MVWLQSRKIFFCEFSRKVRTEFERPMNGWFAVRKKGEIKMWKKLSSNHISYRIIPVRRSLALLIKNINANPAIDNSWTSLRASNLMSMIRFAHDCQTRLRHNKKSYSSSSESFKRVILYHRVCLQFRLMNLDDYFWVDFDHFWIKQYFWRQLGQ